MGIFDDLFGFTYTGNIDSTSNNEKSKREMYSDTVKCKRFTFSFAGTSIEFVCVDNISFYYSDKDAFSEIQRKIGIRKSDAAAQMELYNNDTGYMHELWQELVGYRIDCMSIKLEASYDSLNGYTFRPFGSRIYHDEKSGFHHVDNLIKFEQEYFLNSPEGKTKEYNSNEWAQYDDANQYIDYLEKTNGVSKRKWEETKNQLMKGLKLLDNTTLSDEKKRKQKEIITTAKAFADRSIQLIQVSLDKKEKTEEYYQNPWVHYDNSNDYFKLLREQNGDSLNKWEQVHAHIKKEKMLLDKLDVSDEERLRQGNLIRELECQVGEEINALEVSEYDWILSIEINTYCSDLEALNNSQISKWQKKREELVSSRNKLTKLRMDDEKKVTLLNFLENVLSFIDDKILEVKIEPLKKKYGPIESVKDAFTKSIDVLDFTALVDLYKYYKDEEEWLQEQQNEYKGSQLYLDYVNANNYGAVLVSDKLNQINHNKAKVRYLEPELIERAMIFMYDVASLEEAREKRMSIKYARDKEPGNRGEREVDYALRSIDKSYVLIERKSTNKLGEKCIYIYNSDFMDEKQEFDHIIVSAKGVFNIETKNLSGKIVIDANGNWRRVKDGNEEGMKNPLQQVRRHEKVLQSFLLENCPIVSIVCLANDKAIIEGVENSPLNIVKSDLLVEYIENYHSNILLNSQEIESVVKQIYDHML